MLFEPAFVIGLREFTGNMVVVSSIQGSLGVGVGMKPAVNMYFYKGLLLETGVVDRHPSWSRLKMRATSE